ncbi:MAG: hypothetical protein HQ565_03035 [Bacteroidetes bacterium]|nr:hypothetical protein [Bacteroidota bacterium]
MTTLEDKIKKNREHYDVHEPDEGHSNRFAAKLDAQFHQEKKFKPFSFMRIAAGIIIIAGIAGIMFLQFKGDTASGSADPVKDELVLVADHYDRMADQKLQEISNCAASDEEAIKINEMARAQLDELDKDAGILKEELARNTSNERVFGALVTNYRTRIKILDNIIYQICQL